MSDTVSNVEKAIGTVYSREQDFETALTEKAEAEHEFKIVNAKEFLKSSGSVDVRKAEALVATEFLHKDYLHKDAVAAFTKEKLKDAQSALSARQSILKYERETDFGASRPGA